MKAERQKRTYIACVNCRVRKVKCVFSAVSSGCSRCERERRECIFVDLKKRTVARAQPADRTKRGLLSLKNPPNPLNSSNPPNFLSPPNPLNPPKSPNPESMVNNSRITSLINSGYHGLSGAFEFLAKAAGDIGETGKGLGSNLNREILGSHSGTECGIESLNLSTNNRIGPRSISENSGAPKWLQTANETIKNSGNCGDCGDCGDSGRCGDSGNFTTSKIGPGPNFESNSRPNFGTRDSLEKNNFIGAEGILTSEEAEHLIKAFFATMHPFFPYVPNYLHEPKTLAGYPILLCAVLTIASRYHPLDGPEYQGKSRNVNVHEKLWHHVQRLISLTVWAEASTRSKGTVFAFLLLTEWNPRAIHWRWADYANDAGTGTDTASSAGSGEINSGETGINSGINSGESGEGGEGGGLNTTAETDKEESHTKSRNNTASAGTSSFNGNDDYAAGSNANSASQGGVATESLGSMRRLYRLAWMLIGSAVRLAQDMEFMDYSAKTFMATHVAETNSSMNNGRKSMLAGSLAEVDLDHESVLEAEMEQAELETAPVHLRFTTTQKAHIELLQIVSASHEALYGGRAVLGHLDQKQTLAVLSLISPMLASWERKYKTLVETPHDLSDLSGYIHRESLALELSYAKLYIFSLALKPAATQNGGRLKLADMSRSAAYIEKAFVAANDILQIAHRVHGVRMLHYMPVRWTARIVRAVAFVVKCYLCITAHAHANDSFDANILSLSLISVEAIAHHVAHAAIIMRECSPDELHLCARYSNVLMYIYSEMKTKLKNDPPPPPSYNQNLPDMSFLGESESMEWIFNNTNVGLDFVGPWTELIDLHIDSHFDFDDLLNL